MQKAYSRINWENDPSTNTPLGENNLNKMDKAIDTIDDRVLSLYGYESRVAASEKNAKASETNAKTSEINAKKSEENAKLYMENAFSGTPEGYAQLVEDVRLMDIKTTTDTTLANSVAGGLKINSMSGKSVQDGEPTPDAPIAIHNVGDCVEMMNGSYSTTDGTIQSSSEAVRCKHFIPCKANDVIKIETEMSLYPRIIYYNNGTFVSSAIGDTGTSYSAIVPSGVTEFAFHLYNSKGSGLTPNTVGKITLTINDKYVLQVKTVWKNLLENIATSKTTNGVTFTVNEDKSITISGTSTASAQITIGNLSLSAGSYAFSGMTNSNTDKAYINFSGITNVYDGEVGKTLSANTETTCSLIVKSGYTFNETIYPMIREVGTDDTYAPYTEKAATILLPEPLRQDDVLYKDNGVWYVERKRASNVFDGTESGWSFESSTYNATILRTISDMAKATSSYDTAKIKCDKLSQVASTVETLSARDNKFATFNNNNAFQIYLPLGTFTNLASGLAWLTSNPITVEYELATPTIEELDTDSQIALNSIVTFDDVTYIVVDSRVQPSGIESEYGTSKVGALSLENENLRNVAELTHLKHGVANNLTTTEEGFVLDARQGKVLSEKIEAKQEPITIHTYSGTIMGTGISAGNTTVISTNSLSSMFPNYNADEEQIIGMQCCDVNYTYSTSLRLIPHMASSGYIYILAHNFSNDSVGITEEPMTIEVSLITIPK